MTYDVLGPGALDYMACQYGPSKLTFRGPARDLTQPYVAFLGATQTFGKFIEQPYPLRVEHLTGVTSVNLGQMNAGVDVFAKDETVLDIARAARACVLELPGAANMSNPFYLVHPRRNDRFVRASVQLCELFPEVDFSQFHFTHHMLGHLRRVDPARFGVVRSVLRKTWVRRMRGLLSHLGERTVLLRFGGDPARAPAFVTDAMIEAVLPCAAGYVDLPVSAPEQAGEAYACDPMEAPVAKLTAPPCAHRAAAQALRPVLDPLMLK